MGRQSAAARDHATWLARKGRLMASIERRERDGKTTWRAHWRDPNGRQRNRTFARRVDAQRFVITVESSKIAASYIDPSRATVTVGDLADQWLAGKVDLKPTTRALYESVIATHIKPRWSRTAIGKVEHGAVQAWVAELVASGISAGHVRKIAGVLSSVFGLAMRDRRLASNPATGLSLPRIRERSRRYLSAEEVECLAESAGPLGRPIVLTLAYCGLRWS
jgi:hypothetical protein